MTDLELAKWACSGKALILQVRSIISQARQEGAEEMRERAAQHCTDVIAGWTGRHMAAAIRALPLTPEEPP